MNKKQRVVLKKQNEVSVGLRDTNSNDRSKTMCSSRRSRMGTALWVALAPISLMAVSQASSAAFVDNLANGFKGTRANLYVASKRSIERCRTVRRRIEQ
ncbi:MAG: hypothetical protein CBARDMAM_3992 [uncultured Caballeronia sp.]|nr:MAG: hypothetical protein CBARDMAM_3992 [uncultured Caballeronia sp.]